jgi:hypothetical protein
MTRYAEIHLKIHSAQPIHRRNITVTPQAVDLRDHVGAMPEFYEIRNKVYAHPGNRHLLVQVLFLLYDLRVHWDYILMAKETLLDFGQSRMLATLYKRMAESAVDLFYTCMYPMAEIDRLPRSEILFREKVVEVKKRDQEQNGCPEPSFPPDRFFSRCHGAFCHFFSRPSGSGSRVWGLSP